MAVLFDCMLCRMVPITLHCYIFYCSFDVDFVFHVTQKYIKIKVIFRL